MKTLRKCNKGFSLVELIIVIAIMSVLVGVVGTQVIPYIESSRKARDIQTLSAYLTGGMTAFLLHPDSAPDSGTLRIRIVSHGGEDDYTCTEAQEIADELKVLIAQDCVTNGSTVFASKVYKKTAEIVVEYDFDNEKISVSVYDSDSVCISNADNISGIL